MIGIQYPSVTASKPSNLGTHPTFTTWFLNYCEVTSYVKENRVDVISELKY